METIAETKTREKSRRTKQVARVRVFAVVGEILGARHARDRENARGGAKARAALGAPAARLRRRGGVGLLRVRRRYGTVQARLRKVQSR
jgi:hypothetical protein